MNGEVSFCENSKKKFFLRGGVGVGGGRGGVGGGPIRGWGWGGGVAWFVVGGGCGVWGM